MTYRHRITVERKTVGKDAAGNATTTWAPFVSNVPARWLAGPGREFMAADAVRAETVGRFVIRYYPGITADMRVQWDGQTFALTAPPQTDATARREMTLMVSAGVRVDG